MNNGMKKLRSFVFILLLIPVSCKMLQVPEMTDLTPDKNLFRDAVLNDSISLADVPWKELFTDTYLQNHIEKAVNNNPDMQIAMARISRAEAAFKQSRSEFFPSLNAGFNASFQSENGGIGLPQIYQLYGSSSWEADIWGKIRSAKRASLASLMASEAASRAVMTQLVASVAMNYYTLLSLDAKLEITERTLEKRISNVETMKVLKDNDIVTGADLVLSEANRYSAEVTIPDLKQNIYELENSIRMLTGDNPGPVERGKLDEQDLSPELKTGIPALLLSNRPDVQQAEYGLRASFENIKSARRFFYPSVTLTGRGGISQTDILNLFSAPVVFWNVTAGLLQPIFNHGLNLQRLRMSKADFQEDEAFFKKTLLSAGQEVSDALHSYETASEKEKIRSKQIEFLQKSVDYTMELLKYTSSTSYIDVLTSEVNLLSAQLNSINDRLQQLQSIVNLYQSLGGGWK